MKILNILIRKTETSFKKALLIEGEISLWMGLKQIKYILNKLFLNALLRVYASFYNRDGIISHASESFKIFFMNGINNYW